MTLHRSPAKGVIRLQKGHLQRAVPTLLFAILILGTFVASGHAQPSSPLAGRPGGGVGSFSQPNLFKRPIIGRVLPPVPGTISTQQGSGPNADQNLTSTGRASTELQPNASPGLAQNRIAFVSNGVDLVNNVTLEEGRDGLIDAALPANPNLNIWIMRSDGSEQYQVTDSPEDEVDPCYDPGGRLLAFCRRVSGVWQIFTVEVRDPSIIRQITSGPGHKRHPTWSSDSNYLGFQSDLNGNWDLFKIRSTGAGSPVQLTFGAMDDTDPAWSPAGGLIAFTRNSAGAKRIYTIDEDGGSLEQLSDGAGLPSAADQDPAWRSNGAELAFASTRLIDGTDRTADFNIWRMAAIGEVNGAIAVLVSNTSVTDTADDTNPTWTMDILRAPVRVAFESPRSGNADLWAYQLSDQVPPVLGTATTSVLPSVDARQHNPGDDVQVFVPVYDQESGVASVVARFKAPDQKLYLVYDPESFDTNFGSGVRYLEADCREIGSTILLDDDGDGVFSGTWATPATARDYIIDITVTDNAGNSLTYDDVYGFTTRMFSPRNDVLFVDDYCEGQFFIAQLGINTDIAAAWPVESYWTFNPGYHPGTESTIDYDTIAGGTGAEYDTWRILCRGPIPSHVYQYYLPTIEYQLDPDNLDEEGSVGVIADRAVAVADRAIVWAAPHCGDVWIADGTIMDAATQADVALFVQRGGRLVMAGENLGYALTMDGNRSNSFFSNTLRARYVADSVFTNINFYWITLRRTYAMERIGGDFACGGLAGDPVADDPWGGGHSGDINLPNWFDSDDNPDNLYSARATRPSSAPWYLDAAQFSMRPDAIEALNAIKIYGYGAGESPSFGGPTAGLRYEDTTIENGGKVVYLAFGFEQIHRGYHTPSGLPSHCQNKRSHFIHTALCWERTGGFQGRAVSISDGGRPVNDPAPIVSALQGGEVRYAVRCQRDGTYVMQGLPPGYYDLEATRPGYEIDHYQGELVHGGGNLRVVDFAVKRSQPGAVSGRVASLVGDNPLANVTVSIAPVPPEDGSPAPVVALPDPVQSAADGTFTLPAVPPGDYLVTADGSAVQYGSEEAEIAVNAGDTTTANFSLAAADGTLVVTVTDVDTSTVLANASVEARNASGVRVRHYTDSQGRATLNLAPDTYEVTAAASGYKTSLASSVAVIPAQTVPKAIALKREDPGSITGRVTTSGSGNFLGGVTLIVKFGDQEIARTTSSSVALNPTEANQYNYRVDNVPTGEVTVSAQRTGFTPRPDPHPPVLVLTGQETDSVSFTMDSLHTFPRGLQLVSLPGEYSTSDPATLLGLTASELRMATYETSRLRYRLYPDAPADRFRLGTGYWLNLPRAVDLSQEGLAAADPTELVLSPGWNLVGNPFSRRIDFFLTRVRRSGETATYTLQEALGHGIIGSGLFAYSLGGYQSTAIMAPYTGYWLRANQPCTLIISAASGGLSTGAASNRPAVPTPRDGWLLQLRASVGGVQDTSAYLGGAPQATDGVDFALDQAKPPVPAMGPYVCAAFADAQWSAAEQAVDLRAIQRNNAWNLRVRTNLTGERVTVAWPDMSSLPAALKPVLVDANTGQQVYMRTASGYSFVSRTEEYRLQIVVDAGAVGQLVLTPQGSSRGGSGVAVSYALSQSAHVEATVCNLAGRLVKQVVGGGLQTAGQHDLLWDGRATNGVRVPAGRYLMTLSARTLNGQTARAVVPLSYQP